MVKLCRFNIILNNEILTEIPNESDYLGTISFNDDTLKPNFDSDDVDMTHLIKKSIVSFDESEINKINIMIRLLKQQNKD